eukprot:COSAG01_NODE_12263_length_1770_cov_4.520646_1_plen_89_part_10
MMIPRMRSARSNSDSTQVPGVGLEMIFFSRFFGGNGVSSGDSLLQLAVHKVVQMLSTPVAGEVSLSERTKFRLLSGQDKRYGETPVEDF